MVFPQISTSLHTGLTAEEHPVVGELLQVAGNREHAPKLPGRTRIPVASTRDWQHFIPDETEIKKCIK
jgi:hypothetical protein